MFCVFLSGDAAAAAAFNNLRSRSVIAACVIVLGLSVTSDTNARANNLLVVLRDFVLVVLLFLVLSNMLFSSSSNASPRFDFFLWCSEETEEDDASGLLTHKISARFNIRFIVLTLSYSDGSVVSMEPQNVFSNMADPGKLRYLDFMVSSSKSLLLFSWCRRGVEDL